MPEEKIKEAEKLLNEILQRAKERALNPGKEDREEKQREKKEVLEKKPAFVYIPIHAIDCNRVSKCEFYRIVVFEVDSHTVCVARCDATDRYITRSNTAKCIAYWESCPFRSLTEAERK